MTPSGLPTAPPPPRWAVVAAHVVPLAALPSGLWRIALAVGIPVGYSDAVLREEFRIPGWGVAYVIGLSLAAECLALLTTGLVRPWGARIPRPGGGRVRPRTILLAAVSATALVTAVSLVIVVQLAIGTRTDGHLTGTALTVMLACYAPLVLWSPLLAAVTWSYYRRHRRLPGAVRPPKSSRPCSGLPRSSSRPGARR
ncbi:hypothetical protein [Streptomyces sp. NPDC058953]|uniref:hypothetical protein n=1 Tax=unclassified Streptomyces TaxID=2593676 RepID=UPI003697D31E